MDYFVNILFYSCLAIVGFFLFTRIRNKFSKRRWAHRYQARVIDLLSKASHSIAKFEALTEFDNGYCSNYALSIWKLESDLILKELEMIPNWRKNGSDEVQNTFTTHEHLNQSCGIARNEFNRQFIQDELSARADYFSTILSNPLDTEQRVAIIKDEDHNLVVAGAGCGKTTTVTGKVKYIIDRYQVNPSEIILISFTRKSSEEMDERINSKLSLGVKSKTFNALGLEIIGHGTGARPSVIDDSLVDSIISNCFRECRKNSGYLSKVNSFFLRYLKTPPEDENIANEEDLRAYLKGNDLVSLKQILIPRNGNYERQYCRSYEEVQIADFLLLNQVNYEYEPHYEHNTATVDFGQYRPDFYLPDYGIYIEHFGIDENGNVPRWFGNNSRNEFVQKKYDEQNKRYSEKINWANELHQRHKTTLVKTYSWENRQGKLIPELERKLKELNVILSPLDPKQVWATIVSSAESDLAEFELLLKTFLVLFKSRNQKLQSIRSKASDIKNKFQRERAVRFIELFEPIFSNYEQKLKDRREIDFNDMINQASEILNEKKYNKNIRYIIVDEFQDISFGRAHLLKSLLNANPGCKLFCVGDDWQSIFRFAGSDISLLTDFEEYFGASQRSLITTTYRFAEGIIKPTTEFIEKNPHQIKKQLKSKQKDCSQSIQIIESRSLYPHRDVAPILTALERIIVDIKARKENPSTISVLILGRYNHDKKILEDNRSYFTTQRHTSTFVYRESPNLKLQFLTIHTAKGLEADYVVVLNCNSGKYGFPSERADDTILNLLLSNADQFDNGEERRLFYVALTRTKRNVFLITSGRTPSKFVTELKHHTRDYVPPKPEWDDLPF